jgi:hypothetical protein
VSNEMIHYIAVFSLPDGEHVAHGWAQDLKTAKRHLDGNILGRRRAQIPDEEAKLVSIREVSPDKIDAELTKENDRVRAAHPDRLHADQMFDVANRIFDQRVTPDPEDPEIIPPGA